MPPTVGDFLVDEEQAALERVQTAHGRSARKA